MNSTEELFNLIQSGGIEKIHRQYIPDLNVDELAQLLKPRIAQTGGQNYAIAQHRDDPTDCSDRTEYFDWHSDGLYYQRPPRFVMLHCVDPGHGQINTDVAETVQVLSTIGWQHYKILKKLCSCYVGRGGIFEHPILTGERGYEMLLASRGHVKALPAPDLLLDDVPSIREIGAALDDLYRKLDASAVSYNWLNKGDTLIFNQYHYMHRRTNSAGIDKNRKLIRMWWT